jgi:hypothetical protein
MPSEASLKAANKSPKAGAKSKGPMGIPLWGWVAAGIIGLVIGYTLFKKASGASAASTSPSAPSSGGTDNTGGASSSAANPMEQLLRALGVSTGGTTLTNSPTIPVSSSQIDAANAATQTLDQAQSNLSDFASDITIPAPAPAPAPTSFTAPGAGGFLTTYTQTSPSSDFYRTQVEDTPLAATVQGGSYAVAPPIGSNIHVPGAQE